MGALNMGLASAAPHGTTIRASFTVPAGKKADLDDYWLSIFRRSAAGPVGDYFARIRYTQNGGGQVIIDQAFSNDNTVTAQQNARNASLGKMLTGDNIDLATQDSSTAGTVDYNGTMKFSSYDA